MFKEKTPVHPLSLPPSFLHSIKFSLSLLFFSLSLSIAFTLTAKHTLHTLHTHFTHTTHTHYTHTKYTLHTQNTLHTQGLTRERDTHTLPVQVSTRARPDG